MADSEKSWSKTLEISFCIEAVEEPLAWYGIPDIFNTDQGSQFTASEFTAGLKEHEIKISMDGKSRWMENVFIEGLWRSLKYECVYLKKFENGTEACNQIRAWLSHDNYARPDSTFNGETPDEGYNHSHRQKTDPEAQKHGA